MIDDFINEALESDCIVSVPIENCTHDEIVEIAERAKKEVLVLFVKAEYSNFYQGVLLSLIKRENIDSTFIKLL